MNPKSKTTAITGDPSSACSIEATLDVIGDRWSLLVLRSVFRGNHQFSTLQTELGIARNLLSSRLARLVENEVLTKVEYQRRPKRYEYRLTGKGADLSQALIALMNWGDRWYASGKAPTILTHRSCDAALEQVVVCTACGTDVGPTAISSRPGPGRRT